MDDIDITFAFRVNTRLAIVNQRDLRCPEILDLPHWYLVPHPENQDAYMTVTDWSHMLWPN